MEKETLKAIVEVLDGKMVAVASDETMDRQGESIPIESWDLRNFKQNPILLAGHDYKPQSVIGAAKNIRIDGKKLLFEPVFHDITQLAREIGQMFKESILKTFSVGFIRHMPERDESGKMKGEMRNELLEISAVPVPANPKARVIQLAAEEPENPEQQMAIKSWVLEFESDEVKTAIPYRKHNLAPKGAAWDGPMEVSKASPEDLKVMSTWYDDKNPDVKSSYKLPHHKAVGYDTVWRGVAAAMAAVLGSRGGVDIPSTDRKAVYNHLAKHYRDFDEEPPELRETYSDIELKAIEMGVPLPVFMLAADRLISELSASVPKPASKPDASKSGGKSGKGRDPEMDINRKVQVRALQLVAREVNLLLRDLKRNKA